MSGELALPDSVRTIPASLDFWAARTPEAPALRSVDRHELTFRDLWRAVTGVAERLRKLGVQRQDRVALLLPTGFESVVALTGTMCAAVAVPLNPHVTPLELTRDLGRLGVKALVAADGTPQVGRSVASDFGVAIVSISELLEPFPARPHSEAWATSAAADDLALILHTSGTTGLPKRVPHPQRTLVACARAARARLAVGTDDVALVTTGFWFVTGPVQVISALANGACCVVAPEIEPAQFSAWLDDHRPTWMVATPTEVGLMLDAMAIRDGSPVAVAGSRLRMICLGGQPLPLELAKRVKQSLGTDVLPRYGMTEASYIAWSGPRAEDRREGTCGRALGTAVRIISEAGEDVAPGVVGEIVVRGATLFSGYLDDPEATATAFLPGGWYRTGDLGSLDVDGFLSVRGRIKEQINRGGEKIDPIEVERALIEHPEVSEAAVFAVPDCRLGEDVVAAVVLKPDARVSARAVRAWLLDRLSVHKVPRHIRFVEDLPRTATGKVQRGELSRLWQESHG